MTKELEKKIKYIMEFSGLPEGLKPSNYRYDQSWERLMDVIAKIENLGFSVAIRSDFCVITHNNSLFYINIDVKKTETDEGKRLAVFEAVVTFCEEYNVAKVIQEIKKSQLEPIEVVWERLGDTPVNDDGELDAEFKMNGTTYEVGSDREEIWHIIEEDYKVCIHDLMYPPNNKDKNVN
jgi:hypothetical protein